MILYLKEEGSVLPKTEGAEIITVAAKSDLVHRNDCDVALSSVTGEGIEELKELLYARGFGKENDGAFLLEERHYGAVTEAYDAVACALRAIGECAPAEIYAEDIRRAWLALGTLSGETATEEIVGEIFSRFCVGK